MDKIDQIAKDLDQIKLIMTNCAKNLRRIHSGNATHIAGNCIASLEGGSDLYITRLKKNINLIYLDTLSSST